MSSKNKFGLLEAVCITSTLMITKNFYTSLSFIVKTVGTSAWIMTLVSCITSILAFLVIYMLMKRFPGKDLIEIFELVTGKIIGKLLAIVLCAYFLYYTGINLREFLEMIKAYNLPYTPPSIILGVVVVSAIIFSFIGIEGIARVSYLCFFPVLAGTAAIIIMAIPEYNPRGILPIFGMGVEKTLITGALRSSVYSEVIILTVIIKSIHGIKTFKRAGLISLIITGTTFILSCLSYVMAFDYTSGSENLSGLFQLSRIIYYNRFFQRVEPIFLFTWSAASVMLVVIGFYISIIIYSKTLRIKDYKPLIFPFSFLLFMVSIIPENLSEVVYVHILVIRQYGLIVTYALPVFIFLLALVLRKKGAHRNEET